jgi:hypothetical protein
MVRIYTQQYVVAIYGSAGCPFDLGSGQSTVSEYFFLFFIHW